MKHKEPIMALTKGKEVIIEDEERNHNKWKMRNFGTADFRTGVFRAAKLGDGKGTLKQAIQHLLTCNRENVKSSPQFRDAAVAVQWRFQDIIAETH